MPRHKHQIKYASGNSCVRCGSSFSVSWRRCSKEHTSPIVFIPMLLGVDGAILGKAGMKKKFEIWTPLCNRCGNRIDLSRKLGVWSYLLAGALFAIAVSSLIYVLPLLLFMFTIAMGTLFLTIPTVFSWFAGPRFRGISNDKVLVKSPLEGTVRLSVISIK